MPLKHVFALIMTALVAARGGRAQARPAGRRSLPDSLTVEVVRDTEGFRGLVLEWDDLHTRSSAVSPFTTWPWLFTWWEVFGEDRELRIVVARDGGRLVGVAPLLLRTVRDHGIPMRRLEMLASGEDEADEIRTEYLEFVMEAGREPEVLAALAGEIDSWQDWDDVTLTSVPAESPLRGLQAEQRARKAAVVVPLARSANAFLAAQGKKMREDLRRHRRLIEREGALELVRATSVDDLHAMFPTFAQLHQQLWTSRGEPGCFASDRFTRFHQRVSERLFERGIVHLHELRVGGRPIASRYGFHHRGRLFEYQSGFDPSFQPRTSVGTVAAHLCMEDALARGFTEYDLGEGTRSYKLRWNHLLRRTFDVRIARRNLRTTARAAAHESVERLRELRDLLRRG